jgi:hypothetical protein
MLPGSEALRDVLPNGRAGWIVLAVAAIVAVTMLVLRDRAARRRAPPLRRCASGDTVLHEVTMHDEGQANEIMQYSFLKIFADDRTIDRAELQFIERLALKDGEVDDSERNILKAIFDRVTPDMVTPTVWLEIEGFRQRYGC